MGTRTSYAPRTFCWVDLSTPDLAGAKDFYGGLFDWEIQDQPGPHGVYSMARVGGEPVAALAPQSSDESERGIPPHWNNYVSVADADPVLARARELGANVIGDAFAVGSFGRIGVFIDPTGAPLCLWEAGDHVGAGRVNEPGCLTWNELETPDVDVATRFHAELFGWGTEEMRAEGMSPYTVIKVGERSNGGIRAQSPDEREAGLPPGWTPYFAVDSTDAAIARAGELGGATAFGPMDLPNGGRIAGLRDPQGGRFAVSEGELED